MFVLNRQSSRSSGVTLAITRPDAMCCGRINEMAAGVFFRGIFRSRRHCVFRALVAVLECEEVTFMNHAQLCLNKALDQFLLNYEDCGIVSNMAVFMISRGLYIIDMYCIYCKYVVVVVRSLQMVILQWCLMAVTFVTRGVVFVLDIYSSFSHHPLLSTVISPILKSI